MKDLLSDSNDLLEVVIESIKEQPVNFFYSLLFSSFFGMSLYVNQEIKNGLIEGKHFYFVGIAITFLCIYGLQFFKKNQIRISFGLTDVFVTSYFLYVMLHTVIKGDIYMKSNAFIELLLMTLVYWAGKSLVREASVSHIHFLIFIFLGFGCYHAIEGLKQLYGYALSYHGDYLVTGSFFNPAPYAGYLASILPVGLAIYLYKKSKNIKDQLMMYIGLGTVLIILLIIPSTKSRASWIALLAGAVFVCLKFYSIPFLYKKYVSLKPVRLIVLIMALTISSLAAFGLFYWNKDSANGRLLMWKVSTQIMSEYPLTGVGLNQFNRAFGEQQASYFKSGSFTQNEAMLAGKGEYAFNEYLHTGVEEGLIGLALFLLMIFFGLRSVFVQPKSSGFISVAAAGGLISLLIFGLFSYPFSMTPLLFNFYFFLSILSINDRPIIQLKSWSMGYLLYIGLLILSIRVVQVQLTRYKAMGEWQTASQLKKFSNYQDAILIFEKIEPELSHRGDFMFEYGQALALNENHQNAIWVLEKAAKLASDPYLFNSLGNCYQALKMYDKAERSYLHAWYLIPHKFYPRYLLVKMYEEKGDLLKAKELAEKVTKMEVKVPSRAVDQILDEMRKIIDKH